MIFKYKFLAAFFLFLASLARANGGVLYAYGDHLGSSSLVTDDHGNLVEISAYTPFGEILSEQHSTLNDSRFKYTGQELDRESALLYYGARYYDPTLARFSSVDPLFDSPNPYGYVRNNPIRHTDPTGMQTSGSPGSQLYQITDHGTWAPMNLIGADLDAVGRGKLTAKEMTSKIGDIFTRHSESARKLRELALSWNIDINDTDAFLRLIAESQMEDYPGRSAEEVMKLNTSSFSQHRAAIEYLQKIGENSSLKKFKRLVVGLAKAHPRAGSTLGPKMREALNKFAPRQIEGVNLVFALSALKRGDFKGAALDAGGEIPVVGIGFDFAAAMRDLSRPTILEMPFENGTTRYYTVNPDDTLTECCFFEGLPENANIVTLTED